MTPEAIVALLVAVIVVAAILWYIVSDLAGPPATPAIRDYTRTPSPRTSTPTATLPLPTPPPPPTVPPSVAITAHTNAAIAQMHVDIARRRSEVQAALDRFEATGFQALTALHFQAFKTADAAHALYKSTQASSRLVSSTIERLDRHIAGLGVGVARSDNRYIASRNTASNTRGQLVSTARALQAQTDGLLAGVRQLNANTHTLKERIRTECGQKGRDWHARLESRRRDS